MATQLGDAQKSLAQARTLQSTVDQLESLFAKLQRKQAKHDKSLAKLRQRNFDLESQSTRQARQHAQLQEQLTKATAKVSRLGAELAKAKRKSADLAQQNEEQLSKIQQLADELESVRLSRQREARVDSAKHDQARSQKAQAERRLSELNKKLEQLFCQNERKTRQIASLQNRHDSVKSQLEVQLHENRLLNQKLEFAREGPVRRLAVTPHSLDKTLRARSASKSVTGCGSVQKPGPGRFRSTGKAKAGPRLLDSREARPFTLASDQPSPDACSKALMCKLVDSMPGKTVSKEAHLDLDREDAQSVTASQLTGLSNSSIQEVNSLRNSVHQLNRQKISMLREMTLLNDKFNDSQATNSKLQTKNSKLESLIGTCLEKIGRLNALKGTPLE